MYKIYSIIHDFYKEINWWLYFNKMEDTSCRITI